MLTGFQHNAHGFPGTNIFRHIGFAHCSNRSSMQRAAQSLQFQTSLLAIPGIAACRLHINKTGHGQGSSIALAGRHAKAQALGIKVVTHCW